VISWNHNKITRELQTRFNWVCTLGKWILATSLTPLAPAWAVLNCKHLIVLALTFWALYSITYLFSFSSLSVSHYLFLGSGLPACTLAYALPCICLGSSWAPCHWLLLLGRVGAVFIERRLSLMILFIIFWAVLNSQHLIVLASMVLFWQFQYINFFTFTYLEKIWKQNDPSESQQNYKRITDSVWLSLYIREMNTCNIPHAPSTGLSGTQFSTLIVLASMIPKDQKNITTLKWSLFKELA
jgi:hypothetical protein